ncbi:MAG: RNA 2',3'-cyclic phosphodiesterase [Bacteroidales bacterium]|jgi:2'-5' RNA ligase|nr:RNA 2',3'-cyclic phosphodiesterase [Bacteroidales bacterium]HOL96860.1 RNA 2',3'-cyclic phosphodiesterase [Bacteroidales bacterium]HOM36859.1 RNA 2',3'-cyclic phosphodiesterase [Bacteroidales bacterium]HPD24330.1 RNA 2',3'-cyclic phosphodiesterase [Bacteroidales bacterium]HRS98417.1 RNA 2',3'-cyclic phosphodiesterase [Bacteroidales bacterium]
MKRLFVSIDIPESLNKDILKIQKELKHFQGKITELENLHLTLKFLGETDDLNEIKIINLLSEINFKSFTTNLSNLGVFREQDIRIVWIHLTNCEELQKKVDKALESLYPLEKRFMSHLTIARVKKVFNKDLFLNELWKIKLPDLSFEVTNFRLKESKLTSNGPIYKTVKQFNLIQ